MDNVRNIVYFLPVSFIIMWFKKNKPKPKYKPMGRIGTHSVNDYPYYFTIVMEKLQEVSDKSKVKLLEISKSCDRTDEECLRYAKFRDWVNTSIVKWETDEQYAHRTAQTQVNVVGYTDIPLQNDTVDYTPFITNPFVHNFLRENNEQ